MEKRIFLTVIFISLTGMFCSASEAAPHSEQQREVISLAGEWRFKLAPEKDGIKEKWYERELVDFIMLPGSTDENGYGTRTTDRRIWYLNRAFRYVGPAWYQKVVYIPESWSNKQIILFLERCHWETRVWVDGKAFGMQNSLSVPHLYDLTKAMAPGRHKLTICVDNTVKINVGEAVGDWQKRGGKYWAHSITDHTQTNWNGIVGRIELQAMDKVWISDIQVYPDINKKLAKVQVTVNNASGATVKGKLTFNAKSWNSPRKHSAAPKEIEFTASKSQTTVEVDYDMGDNVLLWDEFSPALYKLQVALVCSADNQQFSDSKLLDFGMREFGKAGTNFTINGRLTFMRGTLECAIFPLTGYPEMGVDWWLRIYEIAKSYGLNSFRFHSWCPPEAAFKAADRIGFMLHVEGPFWARGIGQDEKLDAYIYEECDRMLEVYGNRPSFCMMAVGNEPHGANYVGFLSKIVRYWQKKDPRRLYTGTSGWAILPENDYHVTNKPRSRSSLWINGALENRFNFNVEKPATDFDYAGVISKWDVPVIAHEIGQWCSYPSFKQIPKYTGVLRPRNFEVFRESLYQNHMLDQAQSFLTASGKLQTLLFKEEIEAYLRTPGLGGFHLLQLNDYHGEGTALVGILDSLWNSKGYITPEERRQHCNTTVPLLSFKKYDWTNDETFTADIKIAHFSPTALQNAVVVWSIHDAKGDEVATRELPPTTIPLGSGIQLGKISAPLKKVTSASQLTVQVAIKGTPFTNTWKIYVYPENVTIRKSKDVLISDSLDKEVLPALSAGRKVLFMPALDSIDGHVPGFTTMFWNTAWSPHPKAPYAMGILCDPGHPALANFATDTHSDWQWWDLVTKCKPMVLNEFPDKLRPIVQLVDDWHKNRRLGLIFEAEVGDGKLVVCSIDLCSDLDNRPVARQMLYSILNYMHSADFAPCHNVNIELLNGLLKKQ